MGLEAVIFDCDGVIVDSDNLQLLAEQATASVFAEEHSLKLPEDIDWPSMKGWARKNIAAAIFGMPVNSEMANAFRLAVVEKTIEVASADNTPLVEGVIPFCQYLGMHGIKRGVATSSNRKIYSRYCSIHPIAMDLFSPDYVVAHGECRDNKPKPGPYIEVMKRMGVTPERTVIIEDSPSGIEAGRYAGAGVLAITTTHTYAFLRQNTDAHIVARGFSEAAHRLQIP